MIYVFATRNDYQKTSAELIIKTKKCIQDYHSIKSQICFVLSDFGDEILEECSGLEDFTYLYARGANIYQQLHDIRFEVDTPSYIVEDLSISRLEVLNFMHIAEDTTFTSDFLRWQSQDQARGLYYFRQNLMQKIWRIQNASQIRAIHFSWQSLPTDLCINPVFSQQKAFNK